MTITLPTYPDLIQNIRDTLANHFPENKFHFTLTQSRTDMLTAHITIATDLLKNFGDHNGIKILNDAEKKIFDENQIYIKLIQIVFSEIWGFPDIKYNLQIEPLLN